MHRETSRADVDKIPGPLLIEFGAWWCGYCQALRPDLDALLAEFPQVQHLQIEDAQGKPLGRSFRVQLWPTLIFMKDGVVKHRAVRPTPEEARAGFEAIV